MNFCRSVVAAGIPFPQPGDKDLRARGRGDVSLLPLTPASHGRKLSLVLTLAAGKQQPFSLAASRALGSCDGEIASRSPTSHVLFSH